MTSKVSVTYLVSILLGKKRITKDDKNDKKNKEKTYKTKSNKSKVFLRHLVFIISFILV